MKMIYHKKSIILNIFIKISRKKILFNI